MMFRRENQLVFTSSTGVIILDEGQGVDEHMVDANIEMVGFSPGPLTSFTRPGIFYVYFCCNKNVVCDDNLVAS